MPKTLHVVSSKLITFMVLGMEQNFNAQKPCMVSYKIVLGIEENMDT
jgi:hypothetical protein